MPQVEKRQTQSNEACQHLEKLIGFRTLSNPYESFYSYVSRLIRANLLKDAEIRSTLPARWIEHAFAATPPEATAALVGSIRRYCDKTLDLSLKLSARRWLLFPELNSSPAEYLRGCPDCFADGYHSYAMHGDLIAHCPLHGTALSYCCPRCDTPLLWSNRSPTAAAFQCPRGCLMLKGLHVGLTPEPEAISQALSKHLSWIDDIKAMMSFVSGPVHVAYPPYLSIASIRTPPLPSPGLFPALLDALRREGIGVREAEHFHASSHGAWKVEIARWPERRGPNSKDMREAMRRSFRRGVYHTHIPLVSRERFTSWLNLPDVAKYQRLGSIEKGSGTDVFCVPSYFVTNNEIFALRKLLARDVVDKTGLKHYENYLSDLLKNALLRRSALDHVAVSSELLTVAETFDGVLRVGAKGYWRVRGRAHAGQSGQQTWEEFRERAEVPGGIIHVTARRGPP